MKTIKVSDLQPGPQMDALVAEARGNTIVYRCDEGQNTGRWWIHDDVIGLVEPLDQYNPSTNGGQAMELVKEFKIDFAFGRGPFSRHEAAVYTSETGWSRAEGETPEITICKAVIASKFGETVEVEEGE